VHELRTFVNYRASSILFNFLKTNFTSGKVLIPANICETVPATYWKAGFSIEFVDISLSDYMPDSDRILDRLETCKDITIIHYNHTYGFKSNKDEELFKTIKERFPSVVIIDDQCLCEPLVKLNNELHFADMYLYSTGYAKVVDLGFGGFAHISDNFAYREHELSFDESDEKEFDFHIKQCHKFKLPIDRRIAIGNWLKTDRGGDCDDYLNKVESVYLKVLRHKKEINNIYNALSCKMPDQYNIWRFQLLVSNQDECLDILFTNGLFASKHYMSLGNGYFGNEKTPNVEWLEGHVINLFNDFRVAYEQANKLVELLSKKIKNL